MLSVELGVGCVFELVGKGVVSDAGRGAHEKSCLVLSCLLFIYTSPRERAYLCMSTSCE